MRKPSLLLNNQPNLHPDTSVENLTVVAQKNLTVLPKDYARLNEVSFSSDYSTPCIIHIVF